MSGCSYRIRFAACIAFLTAGSMVYVLGRPVGSTWLLPEAFYLLTSSNVLMWFPGWLPTYTHAAAFTLLSALAYPGSLVRYLVYACAWIAINLIFECLQSDWVLSILTKWWSWTNWFNNTQGLVNMLGNATFDVGDLIAAVAGGITAYLILVITTPKGKRNVYVQEP